MLVLPPIGFAFDLIATFGRRAPFGYRTTIWSTIIVGVLSMIVWGHHMFVSGMNPWIAEYFSVATVAVTIPFAVIGLNLLGSLWRAQIRFTTPMLFALGLISLVGTGGLGGLYLGTSTSDVYFHDTAFVVGHFHLMIGLVTLFGIFGAVYYWFPKMFGRRMNDVLGKMHFWGTFATTMFTFVAMHLVGLSHQLRRVYDITAYERTAPLLDANVSITWAAFGAAGIQLIFFVNFFWSLWKGAPVEEENPWESASLEWTTPTPAGHGNWPGDLPTVDRWPYDYRVPEAPDGFVSQAVSTAATAGGQR